MKISRRSAIGSIGRLALAALAPGCLATGNPKAQMDYYQKAEWVFTKLEDYNPPASRGAIPLSGLLKRVAENGLDASHRLSGNMGDNLKFDDYGRFREAVIREALREHPGGIETLGPRGAVELASKLAAHRMQYYGSGRRAELDKSRAEILESRKGLEEELEKAIDPNERARIYEGMLGLLDTETYLDSALGLSDSMSMYAGHLTAGLDEWPVDRLYMERPEAVCRHYTLVTKAVFHVLKGDAPGLMNTYVSSYSQPWTDLPHRWNQVITAQKSCRKLMLFATFADPTWLDTRGEGHLNAYDEAHFGKGFYGLKRDLETFQEAMRTQL